MNTINNIINRIETKLLQIDNQKKELQEKYGSEINQLSHSNDLKHKDLKKQYDNIKNTETQWNKKYEENKIKLTERFEEEKKKYDDELQHYEFEFNGIVQFLQLRNPDKIISIKNNRPVKFDENINYLIDIQEVLIDDEVTLYQDKQEEKHEPECCVCYDKKVNLIMLECHPLHTICFNCHKQIGNKCPLCKKYISKY